ncbi:MAG: rhodanese-like domain-containing protein [Candidatus Marinimicrobia bacterium]|nr:rhodanese-like domain-containing protein [Candidatus Neomarinimicrobiota bacterium]
MLNSINEISFDHFIERLENGSTNILDVREAWEQPQIEGKRVIRIPVRVIQESLDQISRTDELIVICQHGVRSKAVVEFLHREHNYENLINLRGGVSGYIK